MGSVFFGELGADHSKPRRMFDSSAAASSPMMASGARSVGGRAGDLSGNLVVQLNAVTDPSTAPGQSATRAAAICVYGTEFDAGGLNCSLQLRTCFIRNPRAESAFKSLDGREG